MYAAERQQEIVRRARDEGRVDVSSLAHHFGITTETVRRDLTRLERHGLLRRVHGGALPVERLGFEPAVDERTARRAAEKERIGKAALAFLPQEGAVLIDAGTTTARFADALPSELALTLVTNALPIALQLARLPKSTLLTIGGRVRERTLAQVDAWARQSLESLHVDVAFLAANGIAVERGLTTPDLAEAEVKRAMVAAAAKVVVLADSTKFGQVHFARFADLNQIDVLITDDELDPEAAETLRAAGVQVVLA